MPETRKPEQVVNNPGVFFALDIVNPLKGKPLQKVGFTIRLPYQRLSVEAVSSITKGPVNSANSNQIKIGFIRDGMEFSEGIYKVVFSQVGDVDKIAKGLYKLDIRDLQRMANNEKVSIDIDVDFNE